MARTLRGAPARPHPIMARGGRLPRTAGRPPRFLRTGHQRATSLSEAHFQEAAQRDAGHTLGREAEGVVQSLLFHRESRGLGAQRATFRVLAEGDPDVDAALASAVGCSPPPRSLTPPRATALTPEGPCCARLRRCPDCPEEVVSRLDRSWLLLWLELASGGRLGALRRFVQSTRDRRAAQLCCIVWRSRRQPE